jgi:hypothetical protein
VASSSLSRCHNKFRNWFCGSHLIESNHILIAKFYGSNRFVDTTFTAMTLDRSMKMCSSDF